MHVKQRRAGQGRVLQGREDPDPGTGYSPPGRGNKLLGMALYWTELITVLYPYWDERRDTPSPEGGPEGEAEGTPEGTTVSAGTH